MTKITRRASIREKPTCGEQVTRKGAKMGCTSNDGRRLIKSRKKKQQLRGRGGKGERTWT